MRFSKLSACIFSVIAAVLFPVFTNAQELKGTVIDGQGNPLEGATVKLLVAGQQTTTDAQGAFSFAVSAAENGKTGAIQFSPFFRGNRMYFRVPATGSRVTIELCDLGGRTMAIPLAANLSGGAYSFCPAAPAGATQTYIIRLRIGTQTVCLKSGMVDRQTAGSSSTPARAGSTELSAALAKKVMDDIDTIAVTKNGYLPKKKSIADYTATQIIILALFVPSTETAVFSERITKSIDWANTAVWVWDQGTDATKLDGAYTDAYEGSKSFLTTCGSSTGWSGWGIAPKATDGDNMTGFTGGKLHLAIKGDAQSVGVMVSWNVPNAAKTLDLGTYGYISGDSAWHVCNIPLSDFGDIVLSNITYYVSFVCPAFQGGSYTAGAKFAVDDITWQPAK